MNRIYSMIVLFFGSGIAVADSPKFNDVVKSVEARFEPAKARPGETVTLKITMKLAEGWWTYPTFQPDPGAKSMINQLHFPASGPLVFIGEMTEPANPKEKPDLMANIEKMLYYPGGGTWEKKVVVHPSTNQGAYLSTAVFRIQVCDSKHCLAPKSVEAKAQIEIAGAPVAVDPKYRAALEKLDKK